MEARMIDTEPLPDFMYSRDVALRLMRHAVWSLYYGDIRSAYPPEHLNGSGDDNAIQVIAAFQRDVIKMSTGDFFRIKILGTPDAYIPKGSA